MLKIAKLEEVVETHMAAKINLEQEISQFQEREIEYKNQMVLLNYQNLSFSEQIEKLSAALMQTKSNQTIDNCGEKASDSENENYKNDEIWAQLYCHQQNSNPVAKIEKSSEKDKSDFLFEPPQGLDRILPSDTGRDPMEYAEN